MQGLDLTGADGIDQDIGPARSRQQDAAFLEGLADGGNPETERHRIELRMTAVEIRTINDLAIPRVDAAARKYQGAGVELDLMMAHHHEDLDLRRTPRPDRIAQQQDGGSRARHNGFNRHLR